jgi:hypothetical protein
MSLLPNDDDLDLIHTRQYETRVYQISEDELMVRGAISDMKPPGLYVLDDPEPLEVHQMQLELRLSMPDLTIRKAQVVFETHPHSQCPLIARDYEKLEGLSIARGFNRKIRDLFGGERGCTHTNALLQAMAPAVIQATWSVSIRRGRESGGGLGIRNAPDREKRIAANMNTCHIWAEDGEHVASLRRGEAPKAPLLPVHERLAELGREGDGWE